jgi:hypothetical protein
MLEHSDDYCTQWVPLYPTPTQSLCDPTPTLTHTRGTLTQPQPTLEIPQPNLYPGSVRPQPNLYPHLGTPNPFTSLAVVVFKWIQVEIRAMCVVLDAVTGAL